MKTSRLNLTVKELKFLLKDVPDDYPVIIPCCDPEDADNILGFRYVRKVGILHDESNFVDDPDAFYLGAATSIDGNNTKSIQKQLDESGYYTTIKAKETSIIIVKEREE